MKIGSYHTSPGKWKSKWQCNTTPHPLAWPKSGTLTTPNAGKDAEHQKLSVIAGRNAKCYSPFGKQVWRFLIKLLKP